jgi:hypothetical protein|tara:strand:+ start:1939 stop:2166 length:228 start_codon:yes stop_codon:yes gene_type:complete
MLFTAAILVCLADKPHNYMNCQVLHAHVKYPTEERCWQAINNQAKYQEENMLKIGYELIGAKCTNWLPKSNIDTL